MDQHWFENERGSDVIMESDKTAPPVVFLGPSLPRAEAAAILDAEFRPPVRRGDLSSIGTGRTVLILDGEFDQNFSVSPKEILALLDRGNHVLGAASMGAIRASELRDMGMYGLGRVFEAYLSGRIIGDDEVALAYCPWTYANLTVPLVNIRFGLEELVEADGISPGESLRILRRVEADLLRGSVPRSGRPGA